MRIITFKRLVQASVKYPLVRSKIENWYSLAKAAEWNHFAQTRLSFRHADQITASSGKTLTIFNLGDSFRLVTAIHYNRKRIFVLRVLTHADYNKGIWKETL